MILSFKVMQKGLLFLLIIFINSFSFAGIQYIDINNTSSQSSKIPIVNLTYNSSKKGDTKLDYIINRNANINKIDPLLIKAIIKQESGFNMLAVSPKGAKGLMQLMPATALNYGNYNLFNPEHNVEVGSKHFAYLLNKYGKIDLALAAYNAGEGSVAKYGGIPPFKETQNYVFNILKQYNALLDKEILRRKRNTSLEKISELANDPAEIEVQADINPRTEAQVLYLDLAL